MAPDLFPFPYRRWGFRQLLHRMRRHYRLRRAAVLPVVEGASLRNAQAPHGSKSALNLLVVEDDKDLAGFIRQGVEDESCSVKLCFDGLRQAEIHAFDIILLDVMLPELNGFEVTGQLPGVPEMRLRPL